MARSLCAKPVGFGESSGVGRFRCLGVSLGLLGRVLRTFGPVIVAAGAMYELFTGQRRLRAERRGPHNQPLAAWQAGGGRQRVPARPVLLRPAVF